MYKRSNNINNKKISITINMNVELSLKRQKEGTTLFGVK